MTSTEKYLMKWDGFYKNISNTFNILRGTPDFTDVTLVCNDNTRIEAHRVILSSGSTLFSSLLKGTQNAHPLIFLRGVKSEDMAAIVNFIYRGEVNIYKEDVNGFLSLAEDFKVKGLSDSDLNTNELCKSTLNQSTLAKSLSVGQSIYATTASEPQELDLCNTSLIAEPEESETKNEIQNRLTTKDNSFNEESEEHLDPGFIKNAFDHSIFQSSQRVQVLSAKKERGGMAYHLKICDGIQTSGKVATKDRKSNKIVTEIIKKGEKCIIEIRHAYVKNGNIVLCDFDIIKFCGLVTIEAPFVKYIEELDKKEREQLKIKHADKKTTIVNKDEKYEYIP